MLPLWVKVVLLIFNTLFGAYGGYLLGLAAAYYAGDHGNVASAMRAAGTLRAGVIACSLAAFMLTKRGLVGF